MLDKKLHMCEIKNPERHKWCGIGTGCVFFDTDGKRYPCSFITPMTFPERDLNVLVNTDYSVDNDFIDDECFDNCYIYTL